jgi:hypothetical protein
MWLEGFAASNLMPVDRLGDGQQGCNMARGGCGTALV